MAYDWVRKTRNLYSKESTEPFSLSRSKIEYFIGCPRCFWLDRKHGISEPAGYPFSLNSAVDKLLKKEFDEHRANQTPHKYMIENKIDAVPFKHEKIDKWRDVDYGRGGVRAIHKETNLDVNGAVDDIWENKNGELYVVDYKATSKDAEVTLDAEWQDGYKRQIEIYQWLLRQNGFKVSNTGYFVYCNGRTDVERFDEQLLFEVKVIGYEGTDTWIEDVLKEIKECLDSDEIPESGKSCKYCPYRNAAGQTLLKIHKKKK